MVCGVVQDKESISCPLIPLGTNTSISLLPGNGHRSHFQAMSSTEPLDYHYPSVCTAGH